jgi:hypothetical protein
LSWSNALSITPESCVLLAKLQSNLLPIPREEWVVIVSNKGKVLLSRCDAVVFAAAAAVDVGMPCEQMLEQVFDPVALGAS